jgi:hypothetical protein
VFRGAARACGSTCQDLDVYNTAILNVSRDPAQGDNVLEIFGQGWPGVADYSTCWGVGWPANYEPFKTPDGRLTLADWQTQYSLDLHRRIADPEFESTAFPLSESHESTGDLRARLAGARIFAPKSGSPLVGAGTPVGAALDFFGKERGDRPSIGAIEP